MSRMLTCTRSSCHALLAALSLGALSCAPAEDAPEDGVKIGLLLPFTGTSSATSSNFERAAMFAASNVNTAGGISGKKLQLVAADTHSELERAERSVEALLAQDIEILIGPESADIAAAIAPRLAERGVVFLSPLVGAANDLEVDCTRPWFRLAPSARSLGEALAKELGAREIGRVALLFAGDSYNQALRGAVASRFERLGGTVSLEVEVDPDAQGYSSVVRQVLLQDVDAIVLATSARTGALIVNEMDALSRQRPTWFLSPLLKTELLVQNVAPSALEGAIGVAPRIYDTGQSFPVSFSSRWDGDQALEGAYFYYDAVSLSAFALAKHAHDEQEGEGLELSDAVLDVAATRGQAYRWYELPLGLDRLESGAEVNYTGLTGPMLLQDCGERQLGATTTWEVRSGAIVDVED
jgi:ABC-type branched-subunit amino acid transport system substrate-binding protein